MSGTVAPATLEKTMPVNSLMPSVFMHAVGDLLALAGLQAVVLDHELHRHAAELAALHVDRELERVADVLRRDSRRDPTAW